MGTETGHFPPGNLSQRKSIFSLFCSEKNNLKVAEGFGAGGMVALVFCFF